MTMFSDAKNYDSVTKGVIDAWDFWLSQHDYTVPELIEDAVHGATRAWLNANTPALIAAIAEAVANRHAPRE